jgi:putative endonuclease
MSRQERTYYVYILTNRSGTLYTGMTSNLERRIDEHRQHVVPGFTSKYKIDRLVYLEQTTDVYGAKERERQIKAWTRAKRIALINQTNPKWLDLASELYKDEPLGGIR